MEPLSKNISALLFTALTGVLVVVASISYNKILQFNKSVDLVIHTKVVKSKIIEVISHLKDAEIGQRGYLLTEDSVFLQPYLEAAQRSNLVFATLDSLLSNNAEQRRHLKKLKVLIDERYLILSTNLKLLKNSQRNSFADSTLLKGKNKMEEVSKQVALMSEIEDKLLDKRKLDKDQTATMTPIFLLVLALFSIIFIALFFFRLQKETSLRISTEKLVEAETEARKKIEASEKRFSNILSQSLMAVAIFKGKDMIIAFANEPLLKIWGKESDIVGKPLFEVMPELKSQQFPKELDEVYTTGIAFSSNENRAILMHNGIPEERFFSVVYQPYTEVDNTITGVTVIGAEVTDYVRAKKQIEESEEELKKSASHLKLATDSANIGIWSLDIESSQLEWSNIHKTMWGYDEHKKGLTYEDWHKAIIPEDKALAFQKIEEAKVNHTDYDVEYRITRANDMAIRWIKSTGQYYYDEFGVAQTLNGVSFDISERKIIDEKLEKKVNERTEKLAFRTKQLGKINQTLELRNIQLENANVELASFNYVASHDLQEPLRKIQLFSNRILEKDGEKLPDTTKDYFNRINGAAQRMQNLIESLISFSQTNSGEIVFEKTDLNQTLIEVQTILYESITQKNAVIESENLPTLNAIPVQMQQLFSNLIGNALKYSNPNAAPLIKITAEKAINYEVAGKGKRNGRFWKITISDNGIGFEQQYENKIFEVFQRLHGKAEYEGTGIGLAICKKIVQTHSGTITATGEPNVGAAFTFYLSDNNKS